MLIKLVAPIAGANVGYLVYPVIGEWVAFDETWLVTSVQPASPRQAPSALVVLARRQEYGADHPRARAERLLTRFLTSSDPEGGRHE